MYVTLSDIDSIHDVVDDSYFVTGFGDLGGYRTITILNNQSAQHASTDIDFVSDDLISNNTLIINALHDDPPLLYCNSIFSSSIISNHVTVDLSPNNLPSYNLIATSFIH